MNDKNWSSIIVKEGLLDRMEDELILNDYPHVQFIHIQEEAFKNITRLTISNLSELKYLTIENHSFYSTTSLTLSSIYYLFFTQDVPFTNGNLYLEDKTSFSSLTSSNIQSDDCILFSLPY